MQLTISHRTVYRYKAPVKYTAQTLRLTPRRDGGQRVLAWSIQAPGRRCEQIDAHGNVTHLLTLDEPHRQIDITVSGTVEIAQPHEFLSDDGPLSPLVYLPPTTLTAPDELIRELAGRYLAGGDVSPQSLFALAQGVREAIRYRPGVTRVDDPAAAALARGEGVCQDHAHVLISCCRSLGIPARYVSGYICSEGGGDTASHAWVDVWLRDSRAWHSLDVTNGIAPGPRHCRLAVGRDYLDAAPVRGMRRGGGEESMDVSVTAHAVELQ
jgi:transglutaminase-like putative cysteine protease